MQMNHVSQLLAKTGYEVRVIRDVLRRLAATAAPKFSLFDFIRTDEMGISSCIAALLDPKGTHGQGATYLRLFMQMLEADLNAEWLEKLDQAKVITEAQANGMRRLDIHVQLNGQRAIGIENKPWAGDQDLQLADYAQFMERTCAPDGWMLVYLCEREPSSRSISAQRLADYVEAGQMKLVTFRMVIEWLERCVGVTKPIAVRVFIEHLQQFIRKRICAEVDMSEAQTIKEIALASPESLQAALLVGKTVRAIKEQLLEENLRLPLDQAMREAGLSLVWGGRMLDMKKYTGFGARFSADAPGYLRFEFDDPDLNALFWGIRRREKLENGCVEDADAGELRKTLDSNFGKGSFNAAWLWYSVELRWISADHGKSLKNWKTSEMPWLMIKDGTLVKNLVAHVKEVQCVLKQSAGAALVGLACPQRTAPI